MTVSPGSTRASYQNAAFVPAAAATVSAPATTWSLMPSFGVGLAEAMPNSFSAFVSLSQNSSFGSPCAHELELAEERMLGDDARRAARAQLRLGAVHLPRPGVAVPRRRKHVQRVRLRPGVRDADGHEDVLGVALRVVDLDDPVAVLVEHAGVEQLVLGIELAAARVLGDEVAVRELLLRIVVAPAVPRVARQRVEVPPVLLRVLAVVALIAGEAEDPLLQDRVAAVPERESETEPLLDVAEAGEPVLAPAVRARPRVVVRQVLPRGAARAVVLAHRAPLALADVRAPEVPVARLAQAVLEPAEALHAFALDAHRILSSRWSPTRSEFAIAVSAGLTAPMLGKTLVSTT